MAGTLPASAGNTGLILGAGRKLPRASEYLSLCAATTASHTPETLCSVTRSHRNEKRSLRTAAREWPLLTTTGEGRHIAVKTEIINTGAQLRLFQATIAFRRGRKNPSIRTREFHFTLLSCWRRLTNLVERRPGTIGASCYLHLGCASYIARRYCQKEPG